MACLQKGRDYRHLATFSVVMETTAKIESVENVMGLFIYLFILPYLPFDGSTMYWVIIFHHKSEHRVHSAHCGTKKIFK